MSLPEHEALNAIRFYDGRRPEPGHNDEVVVLRGFAQAHHYAPGDRIPAVINGKKRSLRIVGTATSPEYVIGITGGAVSADPSRFAVLWMNTGAVAAAYRMESSFNAVAVSLGRDGSVPEVLVALDRILEPYGGTGAFERARQLSHRILESELQQLSGISTILPLIFLGVAALLVNVVLSRLVRLQQSEIATLKAVGYANWQVGLHFLELVLLVGCLGTALGLGLGKFIGAWLVGVYERYFKLPNLLFELDTGQVLSSITISFLAATTGALSAVRRVVALPPAEAMRPASPIRYRRSILDRLRLAWLAGPSLHMIVRELQRYPFRALLSTLAIAAATALGVVGGWYYDGIAALVQTQFHTVMREDAAVTFLEPLPERSVRQLAHLPGVIGAEGIRMVPVRFRNGPRYRDGILRSFPDGIQMRQFRDRMARPRPLPIDGVVLTDVLAEILGLEVGDTVEVEIHEGERGTRRLIVSGLIDEAFGLQGSMRAESLDRWLDQVPLVSQALLRIDPAFDAEVDRRLKEMPIIADVTRRANVLQQFNEQSAKMMSTMALAISLFAAVITIGVVYNSARIALSMRSRDLASLRVLGFTRGEISGQLLGELAVLVLLAVPIGLLMGHGLVVALAGSVDPETHRLPLLLTSRSYALAASTTLGAALVSALVVRRRLDRLDLIAVLKTRE
jgi:putative ABC transport system permease protein